MERNAQHAFDAEEVMAYLDGELEARRAAALAAHLVSCSECQEVAQGFRALSERMLSFEVEDRSVGMSETMLAALDSGKSSTNRALSDSERNESWDWRRMFARPYVWAFASFVIVAVGFWASIPSLHRSRGMAGPAVPRNGRNFTDLMNLDRRQDTTSNGYKKWLKDDATAVTRSGT